MRVGAGRTQVEWRVVAVTGTDANFANHLEKTLQSFSDEGFAIVNQFQRGDAFVIVANRAASTSPTSGPDTVPERRPRRLVTMPRTSDTSYEEVTYHYAEDGKMHQKRVPNLEAAIALVKEHRSAPKKIVSVNVIVATTVEFGPDALDALLRSGD